MSFGSQRWLLVVACLAVLLTSMAPTLSGGCGTPNYYRWTPQESRSVTLDPGQSEASYHVAAHLVTSKLGKPQPLEFQLVVEPTLSSFTDNAGSGNETADLTLHVDRTGDETVVALSPRAAAGMVIARDTIPCDRTTSCDATFTVVVTRTGPSYTGALIANLKLTVGGGQSDIDTGGAITATVTP